jgi:hypothetical protein
MSREEWDTLYVKLHAVHVGDRDVLELPSEIRRLGKELGLLTRDRNGNTTLSRKGKALFNNTL